MSPTPTVPLIVWHAEDYHSAGEVYGSVATDAEATHGGLVGVLAANAGMAGSDSVGQEWAKAYDQTAAEALKASAALVGACSDTRNLLAAGAYNHAVAEAAANHDAVPPPAPPTLLPTPCFVDTVPSAAGDGIPEPFGWSLIKEAVGAMWPNGHQDELHAAEAAWHTAATDFRILSTEAAQSVTLLQNQQSEEIPGAIAACTSHQTDLNSLGDICQLLGDACGEYAHHLDDAHHKILDELKEFAAEAVIGEAFFAVLAPFTAGISEAAGNTALGARIAVKARRVAAIIAELATKARAIATRITTTLFERAGALGTKVSQWVNAVRTRLTISASKPAGSAYEFNMVENPGPLAAMNENAAAAFAGGKYNTVVLKDDVTLYRGGTADTPLGQWFTAEPPASVANVRVDSAVKPQWIDPKTGVLTGESPIDTVFSVKIPAGTEVYVGPVGYQSGAYLGGAADQIFVPTPWKIPGVQVVGSGPLK
ncbi:WXG100-like domain-containing protein [Nocardia heshunensis]